jgi:hypothetical protein
MFATKIYDISNIFFEHADEMQKTKHDHPLLMINSDLFMQIFIATVLKRKKKFN